MLLAAVIQLRRKRHGFIISEIGYQLKVSVFAISLGYEPEAVGRVDIFKAVVVLAIRFVAVFVNDYSRVISNEAVIPRADSDVEIALIDNLVEL